MLKKVREEKCARLAALIGIGLFLLEVCASPFFPQLRWVWLAILVVASLLVLNFTFVLFRSSTKGE